MGGGTAEEEQRSGHGCCQCIQPSNLGCVDRLLPLLTATARRDEAVTSSSPLHLCIPSSVVFSRSSPTAWYFTDHFGRLQRRPSSDLIVSTILADFAPAVFDDRTLVPDGLETVAGAILQAESGVGSNTRAALTALDPQSTEIYAQFIYSSSYQLEPTQSYIVYLTALELARFLRDINPDLHRPRVFGVLQRFVKPGGWTAKSVPRPAGRSITRQEILSHHHQQVYRILWSPHYTSVECRINHERYNPLPLSTRERSAAAAAVDDIPTSPPDHSTDSHTHTDTTAAAAIFSKLATFDGPSHLSQLNCVTQPLHRHKFDSLCGSLVRQIESNRPNLRVKYLELFAKLDHTDAGIDPKAAKAGRVTLMYARSMRVVDLDAMERQTDAAGATLCLQCDRCVDFSNGESIVGRYLADSLADGTKESQRSLANNSTAFVPHPLFDEKENDSANQMLVPHAATNANTATTDHTRPKTPMPKHLRSQSASFSSAMTPYELSASLGFDLLAPLPDELEDGGVSSSMRPRSVADAFASSPSIRRRAGGMGDVVDGRRASVLDKYNNDVMGLYTRDLHASRRKQMRVALQAARPQTSTTAYRQNAPAPAIGTCRFLEPRAPVKVGKRPTAPHTTRAAAAASANAIPTLADMIGTTAKSSPPTAENSRAVPKKPTPMSVWNASYHSLYHRTKSRTRPAIVPRPHFRSAMMMQYRPLANEAIQAADAAAASVTPAQPRGSRLASVEQSRQSRPRPHTAAASYQPDPATDPDLLSYPTSAHYLPNPFDDITSSRAHAAVNSDEKQPTSTKLLPPTNTLFAPTTAAAVRMPSPPTSVVAPYSAPRAVSAHDRASTARGPRAFAIHGDTTYAFERFLASQPQCPSLDDAEVETDSASTSDAENAAYELEAEVAAVQTNREVETTKAPRPPTAVPPRPSSRTTHSARRPVTRRPLTYADIPAYKVGSSSAVRVADESPVPKRSSVTFATDDAADDQRRSRPTTARRTPNGSARTTGPLAIQLSTAAKTAAAAREEAMLAAAAALTHPPITPHDAAVTTAAVEPLSPTDTVSPSIASSPPPLHSSTSYSSAFDGSSDRGDGMADYSAPPAADDEEAEFGSRHSTSAKQSPMQNPLHAPRLPHVLDAFSPVADPVDEDDYDVDVEYAQHTHEDDEEDAATRHDDPDGEWTLTEVSRAQSTLDADEEEYADEWAAEEEGEDE